jgi:hypothetical protein
VGGGRKYEGLEEALDALAILSAPPARSTNDDDTAGDPTQHRPSSHSRRRDSWNGYNNTNILEDSLRIIAKNITTLILQPQIAKCRACLEHSETGRSNSGTNSNAQSRQQPTWQLRESTSNSASSPTSLHGGTADSSSSGAGAALGMSTGGISTKGSIWTTLEWSFVANDDTDDHDNRENTLENANVNSNNADATSCTALATTTATKKTAIDTEWWSDLLKFIQSVMSFVHEKALLGRKELSHIIGRFVYGHPSSSCKKDTIRSAMPKHLRNAMMGRDDVSTTNIMSLLSKLMWDKCLPSTLHLTPSALQTAQRQLRQCTHSFEQHHIQCGFLKSEKGFKQEKREPCLIHIT